MGRVDRPDESASGSAPLTCVDVSLGNGGWPVVDVVVTAATGPLI